MATIDLTLRAGCELSVRRFAIREALSAPFEATIVARSPDDDLDLDAIVGEPAQLTLRETSATTWSGVVRRCEQLGVEPDGLSTYELVIVPALWLLSQRTNHRVLSRASAPEMVATLLDEWAIEAAWEIERAAYPKLEYRVQYGESDLAFASRLLEEAGISYAVRRRDGKEPLLVLSDRLHAGDLAFAPLAYADEPTRTMGEAYVTKVRLARAVKPGRAIVRDLDFRRPFDLRLEGDATADEKTRRLEQHAWQPGAFQVDTPNGEGKHDERWGQARAAIALERERGERRGVVLESNVDVLPGQTFAVRGHPRRELGGARLLAVELAVEGTHDGAWKRTVHAAIADAPWRPRLATARPRALGVQSALVVGPEGEAIHVDELGRVRLQFAWDREGRFDDKSSCWVRVSQGWAGGGYGMMAIPRVGQEVLVSFLEGDPDQPIVVGRVFNGQSPVPYKLPESKTITTWRSDSTPGSGGYNEIKFDDDKGRELVSMRAERNLDQLVRVDASVHVGHDLAKTVGANELETTGLTRTVSVGVDRLTSIGGVDVSSVGVRHEVVVGGARTVLSDRKITLSTGEATITLDGPNIRFEAAGSIALGAAKDISIRGDATIRVLGGGNVRVESDGGEVVVQGGPMVRINPEHGGKLEQAAPPPAPEGADLDGDVDEAEESAVFDPRAPGLFADRVAPGGEWDPDRFGPGYADYGYFHLGVMSGAMGLPEGVALRQAGKRRGHADAGNGLWGGKAPYGNEPRQAEMIARGMRHYDRRYGS